MSHVKSKQRVADHGEVFTPAWLVESMLDLVKSESERIDSRFLEPACGSGNFLVSILRRKLAAVELKFRKSDFEKRHYALLALMCTYGIELLEDNIAECRANMLEILADYLNLKESDELYRAAAYVLSQNIVHGDALKIRTSDDQPITFAEWGYLGKGNFQRRDFRLDVLTQEEKDYKSKRKLVQEKLIKFATRIPAFMYLTDFRENTLQDVITKLEPDLFRAVTGLTVKDFHLLVRLKVFNTEHMNQAVFAFRRYEDASLRYTGVESHAGLTHYGLYDTVVAKEEPAATAAFLK